MSDLTNFVHNDKPKVVLSALSIVWHWDVENDTPEPGRKLYVIVETNYGWCKQYRLHEHAELFIDDEETGHTVWLSKGNFNLLNADEEDATKPIRQIFAWAYFPDDADIFPMSVMNTILQKKRWNNA
jgi:hypothetical protein